MNLHFESDRLRFDPLVMEDIDLATEQFTDPQVMKYLGDEVLTEEKLAEEMPKQADRWDDILQGWPE